MSSILDLSAVKDGTNVSDVIVYISSYEKKLKKDGKNFYIAGNLVSKDSSLSFKVWDAPIVDVMGQTDLSGCVVKISGSASSYMNSIDMKITSIALADEKEYPKSLFLKSADVENLFKEFGEFIMSELSTNGVNIVQGIFKNENLFGRFKEEFAGSKMHDAQIGGLLNHTLKMLRIAKVVCSNEPRIETIPNFKDMLYMGIIFHDIGKVYEMDLGVYTDISFVTHRTLGMEILVKYKAPIIQYFDEHFYYTMLSVLQGHHGKEWGDAPTSVAAFLVHLIDMVDSQTTGIFDKLERNEVNQRAGNNTVYVDGSYLTV